MTRAARILRQAAASRWVGFLATATLAVAGALAFDVTLDLRVPLADTPPSAIVRALCAIAACIIAHDAAGEFEAFVAAWSGDESAGDEDAPLASYLHWPIAAVVASVGLVIALRGWSREVGAWL
jgi:hypothetical protein